MNRESRAPGRALRGAMVSGGFTLLELLIVLAVAGVLGAVAVPSLAAMVERNRVAAANNEFLSSIYLLRSEAVKRNRIVKMCRRQETGTPRCDSSDGGGWHSGWLIWLDADASNQIDAGELVIHTHASLAGDLRLTGSGSVANRIAFQPTGATHGVGNGTFTICVPGSSRKRQIIISKAGRVRTRDVESDGSC